MMKEELHILVVDDVNTMRVHIRDLLKASGFKRVTLASSGEEAKKMLEGDTVHLVMADWAMQPGDGFDLLKYVRSHPNFKATAFIMVTAENTKEKVIAAIKEGVDDYLVKPLTAAQIQNKVFGVLLKRQLV